MSNKILNKVNNDIFSYDTTGGGVFKMSRVMPTEIHHNTDGVGTSGYILTSTGNGWSWTDPATLSSGSTSLISLTDTSLSNPQNGDILEYDSTSQVWKNVAPSSGSGGTSIVQNNTALVSNLSGSNAGPSSITLGAYAGNSTYQSVQSIAIGQEAQSSGSGEGAISIGYQSGGRWNYGPAPLRSISIGYQAGRAGHGSDGTDSIDIGYAAGNTSTSINCVSIGFAAGQNTQGESAIAIGYSAGQLHQGDNSIAIGYKASQNNTSHNVDRYIVLNAQTVELNPDNNDAFYVKPIRSSTNDNKLLYNATTGEITYQPDTPSAGVSNVKVYGSIWCDADYVITGYTLWGGGNANPISTNAGWASGYDFINSHPGMWISPNTSQNYYWHGGTGNGNVLLIPRDGHYHITIHQLIYNSVFGDHTITAIDMWIGRFRAGATGYYDYPDLVGGFSTYSSAGDNIIHTRATATVFCKAGDRIFGQFYPTSTGGTLVGDAGNPGGMSDSADGNAEGNRRSGFSVFSID